MSTTPTQHRRQITARVTPAMADALDAMAAKRTEQRGTPVDRADVIREALHTAMEDHATTFELDPRIATMRAEYRAAHAAHAHKTAEDKRTDKRDRKSLATLRK